MIEVSQRKMKDSQKEMKDSHKEMSYELNKTTTQSQTQTQQAMVQSLAQNMAQTGQLMESLLANQSIKPPDSTSRLLHEEQLMMTKTPECMIPSPDNAKFRPRTRPKQTSKDRETSQSK